ncbi:hypothetical protein BCR33DRAFT_426824 [Rhizoclosmatium globosum]|uniref:Uncharacterized protein n=1 Tax=Rhizoclosmatium globosum TaxID=329046 RepID=A0A1Y2BV51_9FUNG|nr:hypothetical protein BCR33DRAFT_426824 [Rhizoclosmatium globosum]|eukprot:ORY38626.1 hypothetical protein BCR33DRAFT_426824 [Rhizoclosmatium globosum]
MHSADTLNERKVAPANKRDDYTYRTQRCGLDWYDANSQCGAFCTDNSYCRDGKACYAGLDASPCATWESDPNNGYHDHTGNRGGQGHGNDGSKRCGVDWPDASRRCGYCRDNNDCLGSQTCFGGLDARQCRYDGDQQNGVKFYNQCHNNKSIATLLTVAAIGVLGAPVTTNIHLGHAAQSRVIGSISSTDIENATASRCGKKGKKGHHHARTHCNAKTCTTRADCEPGHKCYKNLPICPAASL